MLISLALLVLLLALLPNALGLGRRAWETHADVGDRLSVMAGLGLLEHRLAEAMPAFATDAAGSGTIAFRGEADTLAFVAPSRSPAPPGLAQWTLRMAPASDVTPRNSARRIVLTSAAHVPAPDVASNPEVATEVAASSGGLTLAYFGRQNSSDPPRWFDTWPRNDALPTLVAITLLPDPRGSQRHPRRIVVALKFAL